MNQTKKPEIAVLTTRTTTLETITDCGFKIIDFAYTGASFTMPNKSLKTKIAHVPRWLLQKFDEDLAVRILGGETLIVLAESIVTTNY